MADSSASSLAKTSAASFSIVSLAAAIGWGLNGFPKPVPDDVVLALAAGVAPLIHVTYVLIAAIGNALIKKLGSDPIALPNGNGASGGASSSAGKAP